MPIGYTFAYRARHKDGQYIWLEISTRPILDEKTDSIIEIQAASRDITERVQAKEALRESNELHSLFMKHSPIYAFIKQVTPTESRVLMASENYKDMIGIPGSEMIGKTMDQLFPAEFAAKITADDWAVVSGGKVLKLDEDLNGRIYNTLKFPIFQGGKNLLAGYTIDITERVQAEDELNRSKEALEVANLTLQTALTREKLLSHTDALTGINNRRFLFELAEREFGIATRYRHPLSVMMFDIDHFKGVNDTFGHAVGDQILQHVTQIACTELRSADVIGRYGGEEFVIMLPVTDAQQVYPVAERIRAGVAALRVPTPKGDASVTISIGIAETILKPQDESVDKVIRRADEAMYAAKQAGRNRTIIFDPK
jgi:diguanylate cyclase (GGDEF)-like protein/PAS domain S-box-containing protein